MSNEKTLNKHSWSGHTIHILRRSRVICGVIGDLILSPHGYMSCKVEFKEKGKVKTKRFSPFYILMIELSILNCDLVTDDEEDDDTTRADKKTTKTKSEIEQIIDDVASMGGDGKNVVQYTRLPKFNIGCDDDLSDEQIKTIKWQIAQINELIEVL